MHFRLSNKTLEERYFVLKTRPWFVRSYKAFLTPGGAIVDSRFIKEDDTGFVFLADKREVYSVIGIDSELSEDIKEVYAEEVSRGEGIGIDYSEMSSFHFEGGF